MGKTPNNPCLWGRGGDDDGDGGGDVPMYTILPTWRRLRILLDSDTSACCRLAASEKAECCWRVSSSFLQVYCFNPLGTQNTHNDEVPTEYLRMFFLTSSYPWLVGQSVYHDATRGSFIEAARATAACAPESATTSEWRARSHTVVPLHDPRPPDGPAAPPECARAVPLVPG